MPELDTRPGSIVVGGGDSAWVASRVKHGSGNYGEPTQAARVDRIDGSGNVLSFPVRGFSVLDLASAPGATFFFREGYVGRIRADGSVREFPVRGRNISPSLAYGAGGYLWLTEGRERGHDAIKRISRGGKVKKFPLPHLGSEPRQITRGKDGAMWFTEDFGDRIGRITSTGRITEYPLQVRAYGETEPVTPIGEIAVGREGDIWFGTFNGIGRLSPSSGKVIQYFRREVSKSLIKGPDGRIWFAEGSNKIVRISPAGQISVIHLPGPLETVTGLAAGADGSVWYTADPRFSSGVVGRILLGGG